MTASFLRLVDVSIVGGWYIAVGVACWSREVDYIDVADFDLVANSDTTYTYVYTDESLSDVKAVIC